MLRGDNGKSFKATRSPERSRPCSRSLAVCARAGRGRAPPGRLRAAAVRAGRRRPLHLEAHPTEMRRTGGRSRRPPGARTPGWARPTWRSSARTTRRRSGATRCPSPRPPSCGATWARFSGRGLVRLVVGSGCGGASGSGTGGGVASAFGVGFGTSCGGGSGGGAVAGDASVRGACWRRASARWCAG